MKLALRVLGVLILLVAAGLWVDRLLNLPAPPPTEAEISALERRRDELTQRIQEQVVKAGEKSLAKAPRAGVMIGIPTSYAQSIVEQVVTGLFGETTLTLRNLKVHKEGEVKAKMVFRKKAVGKFVLDVDVHEARGVMKPGPPTLGFDTNEIRIGLPVDLAHGEGRARLRLAWDSKGLAANVVCGDVDLDREVMGKVVPESYRADGVFRIRTDGNAVVLHPDFGELAVRIFVDPSEQAWKVVDEVVAEQRAGCRTALEKIDIKGILAKLLGKGFNVKVPKTIFKPVRLPAGVQQSLDVQGVRLDLSARATGLLVSDDRLWYGADLTAQKRAPAPPAEAPKSKEQAEARPRP